MDDLFIPTTRRLSPRDFRILFLWVRGLSFIEIAERVSAETGRSCSAALVSKVVRSEAAQEILARVESHTLDTMNAVQTDLQMVAPAALARKIQIAMESKDERLANKSCTELLAMAGNGPVRRVSVEPRDAAGDKFGAKTDEQIRASLIAIAQKQTDPVSDEPDEPGEGPDGNMLN